MDIRFFVDGRFNGPSMTQVAIDLGGFGNLESDGRCRQAAVIDFLLDKLKQTKTNADFFDSMNT